MTDLKPCPFCGGTDIRMLTTVFDTDIWCDECKASIYRGSFCGKRSISEAKEGHEAEAIKAWNRCAQQEAEQQGPCSRCGYGGKYLDAPPCTICPAHPKVAKNNTPPSTTADRIRAMSDGELAALLCNIQAEKALEPCKACVASDTCRAGHNGFIDWLQQPAQEE